MHVRAHTCRHSAHSTYRFLRCLVYLASTCHTVLHTYILSVTPDLLHQFVTPCQSKHPHDTKARNLLAKFCSVPQTYSPVWPARTSQRPDPSCKELDMNVVQTKLLYCALLILLHDVMPLFLLLYCQMEQQEGHLQAHLLTQAPTLLHGPARLLLSVTALALATLHPG